MRVFKLFLIIGLVLLQYRLWFGHNGVKDYYKHRAVVSRHIDVNQQLVKRNKLLVADVVDLKTGLEAIEERARHELGMIREGETFFRIIPAQDN
ncbi:MAG: cell division protein FtsB [Phenylobacterium sp.]|jgi:cell division protein FtsB